ncbi:hypothetical protein H6F89_29615 [Cyanobacteria bacterium FACHB-63]|nr:hypothetical protein [Cyanobacteria bacterium FACHB-63]
MAMEEIDLLMNSEPAIVIGAIAAWAALIFITLLVAWGYVQIGMIRKDKGQD